MRMTPTFFLRSNLPTMFSFGETGKNKPNCWISESWESSFAIYTSHVPSKHSEFLVVSSEFLNLLSVSLHTGQ